MDCPTRPEWPHGGEGSRQASARWDLGAATLAANGYASINEVGATQADDRGGNVGSLLDGLGVGVGAGNGGP